ncbi:unnamed protein product [Linum tenue]|uniref:Uncharacterized protein n=1 Tax=Linum tenue TaxID=586396 RepID=A0AAV0QYS6_9ROSI|nr:unnamed protein product [Linum tenue]
MPITPPVLLTPCLGLCKPSPSQRSRGGPKKLATMSRSAWFNCARKLLSI